MNDFIDKKSGIWAVVAAAGRGERMGLGYNKAFMPMGGVPMIIRTLTQLRQSGVFDGIVAVTGVDDMAALSKMLESAGLTEVIVATGGASRQQSVLNGLNALPDGVGIVAVHDAARPYVSVGIIRTAVDSALQYGSGVISTPVTDTIKRIENGGHVTTLPRGELRAVQTPQVFRLSELKAALERCEAEGVAVTDEAQAMEICGYEVRLVTTDDADANIKITYPGDIRMGETRVGYGYDAHRLVEGRRLVLCGLDIDYEKGLLGHSDADVATHALIDALLGAAGLGDIGRLYPDTDERYRGVYSIELLRDTSMRLRSAGYAPVNIDITIVAQRPKLSPHIADMTRIISDALNMDASRINIKGKTTEGMGFEGAGEGISAHCVAAVREI